MQVKIVDTYEEQELLWLAGTSVHVRTEDMAAFDYECCPDFSCCDPKLLQPVEVRERFQRANKQERDSMLSEFLAAFVASLNAGNVHVAGQPMKLTCERCNRVLTLGAVYMASELADSVVIQDVHVEKPFRCPACSAEPRTTNADVSLSKRVAWTKGLVPSVAVRFQGTPNVSTRIVEENGFLNVRIEAKP